jgi:hypothetical protein
MPKCGGGDEGSCECICGGGTGFLTGIVTAAGNSIASW